MNDVFIDYKEKVVAEYLRRKEANEISPRLLRPTPAKLKEESIATCNKGIDKKDYKNLMVFFDKAKDTSSLPNAIQRCDINKFKPLVNFLRKNQAGKTEDKNIELLAWLIDYTHRPYEVGKRYTEAGSASNDFKKEKQTEEKKEERIDDTINPIEEKNEPEESPLSQDDNAEPEKEIVAAALPEKTAINFRIVVAAVSLVMLAVVTTLIFWPKQKSPQVFALTGQEACMFWAGDHFQQVSCKQKLGDTLIIALDSVKLNHFKKIDRPDTITRNAIGYVWYVKVNGSPEFYTGEGYPPAHPELRLRPVTLYMINKYISAGRQPE